MHKFVRNLITEWRKLDLPFTDATVVVAVSGGADSMSLLLAAEDLKKRDKFKLRFVVAHLNHKLRGTESDEDEEFVRNAAHKLGFEFVSSAARISKKGNIEQNARNARYKFLAGVAEKLDASVVLMAHTLNDQAETFLMNLIRGSGPSGLAAMTAVRELDAERLLARPLLTWASRSDSEGYCRERNVEFRTDAMNNDEAFTRVKIRRMILPLLSELNPKIVPTLARTAGLIGIDGNDRKAERLSDDHDGKVGSLRLSYLRQLSKHDLYGELRSWLKENRGDLRGVQLKHIESVERLIFSRKSGKTSELPGGGVVVKHLGGLVYRNIRVEK